MGHVQQLSKTFYGKKNNRVPYFETLTAIVVSLRMRLVDLYWPVAQMVERLTVNQMVAGSSPAGSAILRGVAVVAYQPHKLVVAGSSPAPATMPVPRTERRL